MDYNDFLNFAMYFEHDWQDEEPYEHNRREEFSRIIGDNLLCYWEGMSKFCQRIDNEDSVAVSLLKANALPSYLSTLGWLFKGRNYSWKKSFYLMNLKDKTCMFGIHKENLLKIKTNADFKHYQLFFLTYLQGNYHKREKVRESLMPNSEFPKWFWYEQTNLFPYYAEFSRYIMHKTGLYVDRGDSPVYYLNYEQVKHKVI